MDLGRLINFGDKLARGDSGERERALDEVREESVRRSHFGGIAVHGDPDNPYNRGQRNWRYALVDQGAGADGKHVALRVNDGGPHCKQWNLDGKNDDGSYRAVRTSDLPGEWNKSESLRHPEDHGIHQEGRLQAHRAAHDEIYATMQDGRGNGTFRLTRNPDGAKRGFGKGDEWTLRFGPRPKGTNDFAADFVRGLKKSAGLPGLPALSGVGAMGAMAPAVGAGVQTAREANGAIKSLGGVANAMQGKDVLEHGVNAFGGLTGAADLAQRAMTGLPAAGRAVTNYAPGLVKPIAGLAARVNPAAMALNAYQAGDVALHPQARMDETEATLGHQGVVGQALTGMNNPAAATATAIRGGARAYDALGEGARAQAGLAVSQNAVGGGLTPMGTMPTVHPAGFVPTSTTQQSAIHNAFPPVPKAPSLIPSGVHLPAPSPMNAAPTSLKLGQGKDGKFYPPENYDVDERDGGEENKDRPSTAKWTLSSGANDWEVGTTAMSVEIDQYGGTHRIWITVDNSPVGGNDDSKLKRDEVPKVKAWGEKAQKTWVTEAKKVYRPGEVPWREAFWEAAHSEAMKPYVQECGRERQEWVPKRADLSAELRTAFDHLLKQYDLSKRASAFHDPRVGQRVEGKPPRLDLAFFANRSTPQVLRPDLGDEPKPKAGYGDVTLQRRATPEEVGQLNAGKWLRVDEEGRTPRDANYRITQYRLGLAKLRQRALDAQDAQDDQKTASAFIRDRTLISLPDDVRSDIKRFVPDLRHKTAPHYGMVVRELVKKCDPHNLATARAHVKDEPISKSEKEFYAKNDGRKFVLLVNDRVVDAHHFIAKAERIGCTSSLDVLDLTGCRHQSNEKKAGYGLGELIYKTAGGGGDKRLSCLMAPVPRDSNLHGQLYDFAKDIAYDDLYLGDGPAEGGEYGRELSPHVTVLYGFTGADPAPIKKFVQDHAPLRIKLGKLSAFEAGQGKGYDVLKFEVECEELESLHDKLKDEFECEISHPKYNPHLTIAYIKAGRVGKYLDRQKLRDSSFTVEKLEFSDWTKKKTPCPLEGKQKTAAPSGLKNLVPTGPTLPSAPAGPLPTQTLGSTKPLSPSGMASVIPSPEANVPWHPSGLLSAVTPPSRPLDLAPGDTLKMVSPSTYKQPFYGTQFASQLQQAHQYNVANGIPSDPTRWTRQFPAVTGPNRTIGSQVGPGVYVPSTQISGDPKLLPPKAAPPQNLISGHDQIQTSNAALEQFKQTPATSMSRFNVRPGESRQWTPDDILKHESYHAGLEAPGMADAVDAPLHEELDKNLHAFTGQVHPAGQDPYMATMDALDHHDVAPGEMRNYLSQLQEQQFKNTGQRFQNGEQYENAVKGFNVTHPDEATFEHSIQGLPFDDRRMYRQMRKVYQADPNSYNSLLNWQKKMVPGIVQNQGSSIVPKTANLDSLTYPLTGPLGPSTLAATGVGAGLGGLMHLYRATRNKITGQKPDPEENSLLGDVGRGAVLGAATNIGFKGLGGMMGGPRPVNEHPVPYETPMMANDFQPGHALGALVQRGMAPNLPIE